MDRRSVTNGQKAVTNGQLACYLTDRKFSGEPDRIRTCDPLIKSQLLYQLSYGPIARGAKY